MSIFSKNKVTMRPPLSVEDDAQIDYIAKVNGVPKERLVAAMLRLGITKASDPALLALIAEERTEYHEARSTAQKKTASPKKVNKKVAAYAGR